MKTQAAAMVLALFSTAGCGKTGASADQACADLAQARCTKRSDCSSGVGITRNYGDMSTCLAREKTACGDGLMAPGTGNSAALVEMCVAAYPGFSCADFGDNNPPPACAPLGARAAGAACAFNGQCTTGFCTGTKYASCGSCAASPAAGTSCAAAACGHGQICVDSTLLCQDRAALAATCDTAHPCGSGLSCAGDSAGVMGTCQAALTTVGAGCGAGLPGCDGARGFRCGGPAGIAKSCVAITYVGDGAVCGTMADGSYAQCTKGDCYTSTGLVSGAQMGTCKTDAADGAACDSLLGPGCTAPARCAASGAGTAGVCTVPLASSCG